MFDRKISDKKYAKSVKGKKANKKAWKKYRESVTWKETRKKYQQSEKGKQAEARGHAKYRGLGWNLLYPNPFDEIVKVSYHHVNNTDVVPIPLYFHSLYSGSGQSSEQHNFLCLQVIKQVYL